MEKKLVMVPQQVRASKSLYSRYLQAQKNGSVSMELVFQTFIERDQLADYPRRYTMYCRDDDGNFIATIAPVVFDVPEAVPLEEIRQNFNGGLYLGHFVPVDPWVSQQMREFARTNLLGFMPAFDVVPCLQ